jgi:glycosyltransferase involved in cell wall biosynthesis
MKIAIDLRSLSSGSISGVENYIVGLLDHLLPLDRQNQYVMFYNAWSKQKVPDFHFINSQIKQTRVPNKVLNFGLKFGFTKLENLTGSIDCIFLPNLNQFSIHPKTKLAITVHDLSPVVTPEFYDLKRRVWHSFLNYKKSFDRANIIFAVSEYTKLDLMRLFNVPETKIKVVYPGVDTRTYSSDLEMGELKKARNHYELPGNFILFLSTIEPRKNLGNLIKAFELLESNAYLVIVGKKGWKYHDLFRQIKGSKKSAKIKYIGYVNEQDKPKIMKLAQAIVYPSFYEGFGFVPVEAMCLGVPVVAANVTAIPEVIQDAGLLVNPYNVGEIKQALEAVLENDTLREVLIAKGKERAKEFNWQRTAEQVLKGLISLQ